MFIYHCDSVMQHLELFLDIGHWLYFFGNISAFGSYLDRSRVGLSS